MTGLALWPATVAPSQGSATGHTAHAATNPAPVAFHGLGAWAQLRNAAGGMVGVVEISEDSGKLVVHVHAHDLPPGWHGFHIHAVGRCDPATAFNSAGGHMNPGGTSHAEHAGDMPSLLVSLDGTAEMWFRTDRAHLRSLFDADGSAIIVHALPDNFGHIPTRYAPAPDAMTLTTGDAGPRIACGAVQLAAN